MTYNSEDLDALRTAAREKASELEPLALDASISDANAVIEELQVHQIELKMQYEALLRTEHDFITLYDQAPYGYISIDRANRLVRANNTFAKILDADPSHFVGPSFLYLIAKEDIPDYLKFFGNLSTEDPEQTYELHLINASGSLVAVELRFGSATENLDGEKIFNLSVRDLTQERAAQEEIRESRAELDLILNSISEGFFTIDHDMRLQYMNKEAEQILHCDGEALIGSHLFDEAFPAAKGSKFEEEYTRALQTGNSCKFKCFFDDPRHSEWYSVRCTPYPNGLAVFFRPISDEKVEEEKLIRSERLAAVGTLAAGIAHQFNNLNAPVLGFCDLILRQKGLSEKVTRWTHAIKSASSRARDITRSLLTFTRRNSESIHRPYSLNNIILETLTFLERDFQECDITLDVRTQEIPHVSIDPSEISQVILNLMINAKHAVTGCAEKVVSIETGRRESFAFVRIYDTGCGISDDDKNQIFSPFFTTKGEFSEGKSSQSDLRGTGLGLTVAQLIVERHKGEIEVENLPGKGACFTISLPLSGASVPPKSTTQLEIVETDKAPQQPRVLILEDDALTGEVIHDILEEYNMLPSVAEDGYHALLQCNDQTFDVVLIDLHMPKMSGVEFLQRLADVPTPQRPTPIIVTGTNQDEVDEVCSTFPVPSVVRKPFRPSQLINTIHEVLQS